jgi:hypothetical protein
MAAVCVTPTFTMNLLQSFLRISVLTSKESRSAQKIARRPPSFRPDARFSVSEADHSHMLIGHLVADLDGVHPLGDAVKDPAPAEGLPTISSLLIPFRRDKMTVSGPTWFCAARIAPSRPAYFTVMRSRSAGPIFSSGVT